MKLIDTHTHLYLQDFADENPDAVKRAIDSGVDTMIFPNIDLSTVAAMNSLADLYPQNIRMAMGLHPTEVKDDWRDVLPEILSLLDSDKRYVAVGEIGMDLYWDKTFADEQMQVLEQQAQASVIHGLPMIIHCREALPQALEVLSGVKDIKAVFHSFGGSRQDVEAIRRVGDFYFGINGVVTFKNSNLRDVLPEIGIERILLETDSPYLAPVPHRGHRNESSYLPLIAEHIATSLGMDPEQVANVTTNGASTFFNLA